MKPFPLLQHHKTDYKNYLLLLVIALLAYWPISFGVFSVKNDAIHYFLPYRFQVSETLRQGEWPFWNPYIYLGYPVQGDMQSGAWNPIVWIFSLIGRYDITLFHYENLLYIFLGGIGMYKLTNRLVDHSHTALLIAASYMLSGFMLSGQLINWLAAAAFIPFVLHYYLCTASCGETVRTVSFGYAVKTGIALYLLFTAGYPSFMILTGYLLLLLFLLSVIRRSRNSSSINTSWKTFIGQQFLILLVFTGLSLPALVSFIDLLPYYQRGNGTSYPNAVINSFEWRHLLSLIFPSSIKANDIITSTDVTCRNVYVGLFALLILSAFPPKATRRNILLICLALFALLFSLGDATPIRKICYQFVPLMNTFRHPSQTRLFFILAILLLAAPGLKKLLTGQLPATEIKKLKKFTWITTALLAMVVIIALTQSGILDQLAVFRISTLRTTAKNIFDSISISDAIFLSGLIQIFFLLALIYWLKKQATDKKLFTFLWIANLFIMAQLVLPASFVSRTSAAEINAFIHASPKGLPTAGLEKSIAENSKDALTHFDKIALAYFYNKKIGISRVTNSPAFLTTQDAFIENDFLYRYVSSLPVVYIANSVVPLKDSTSLQPGKPCGYVFGDIPGVTTTACSPGDTVFIKKLTANRFVIEVQSDSGGLVVLTQNYHHHWKARLDGKETGIYKVNTSFMSVIVPAGKHSINFQFTPTPTTRAIWVMLATLIILLVSAIVSLISQQKQPVNHK